MLTLLFFITWIINICLSLQKRNRKSIIIISFIFLIIMFCGNTFNRDYWGYRSMYDIGDLSTFDVGFQFVGNICIRLNLHYNIFLSILIIPCYSLLFYVLYKMKTNIHLFFSMYFFFLVFYDITQIRNFIASILLTFALYMLFCERKKMFFLTIFIASAFHSIAFFYIVLPFIYKWQNNKKFIYFLLGYSITAPFLLKIIASNSDIIGKIIQLFSNNDEVIIYGITQINFGFLVPIFYFLFNVLLVFISRKILIKINKYEEYSKFVDICIGTILFSMLIIPLLTVNLTFDRVFRNFSFLYYILVGLVMNELLINEIINKKIINLYTTFLVLFSIVWTCGTIYRYNGFSDTEYRFILENNFINEIISEKGR